MWKKKGVINIGIAQMDILNISTSEHLNSEQKIQISTEVVNYIYNRLSHMKQSLKLDKHLNFIRIPPRVNIDYANETKVPKQLGLDMIVWGTIRYDKESIYINTKLAHSKNITSIFYKKLIDDLNAYPELDFDFSQNKNLEFDKFIHEVIYLSIIYRTLELIHKFKYKEAEQTLLYWLEKLNKLYKDQADQSVNKWDKEVSKIEVLMYFVLSKIYFERSNSLLGDFDYKNQANEKLEKCSVAIDSQIKIMQKYIKDNQFDEISEYIQIENSYLNAMSKLSKTGDTKILKDQLKKIDKITKSKYKHDMVKALIEARFKNFDDAKKHYESALKKDPNNIIVLRGLGLIEYNLWDLDKSLNYLEKLHKITPFYIFNKHLYDLVVLKHLLYIRLKKGNLIKATFQRVELIKRKMHNNKTIKNTYILQSF